jgi:hypothetical protein
MLATPRRRVRHLAEDLTPRAGDLVLWFLLAAVGCTSSSAGRIPSAWEGSYSYQATYGRTEGGSGIMADYQLQLRGKACTITAEGYQTDDHLLCSVRPEGEAIDVLFLSYPDGSTKNIYGREIYHPGQLLFTLSRGHGGGVVTHWGGYLLPDAKTPLPGIYFRQDSAPSTERR